MLLTELPHYLENQYSKLTTAGRSNADVIIDFTSQSQIQQALNTIQPDVIINAIAYTAVDKAEAEQDSAYQINAELPAVLANWCAENNSVLIHYSTDFVFDGSGTDAYKEHDETGPLSVYGESKLAGELAIQRSSATSIILRTSWVYGETGNNFMRTMQRLARERESLGIVADQRGTPTYSRHLAILTFDIIKAYQAKPEHFQGQQVVYHASAAGQTTWHGFATTIFKKMREYEAIKVNDVKAIATTDYPTPATRPENSVLSSDKLFSELGISMPDWQEGLTEAMCRAYADDGA